MRSLALAAFLLFTMAEDGVAANGSGANREPQTNRSGSARTVRKQYGDPISSWGHVETGRHEEDEGPSGKGANRRLKAWIGRNVDALVAAWGNPKRKYVDDNGNDVYVFANTGIIPTPTQPRTATATKVDGTAPIKFSLNFYCDVSFRVRPNKRIVGWRYVGNNCNWDG